MDINDATEIDLLQAWYNSYKKNQSPLTRVAETEVRHVLHYSIAKLTDVRNEVMRPDTTRGHTVFQLKQVVADLEQLIQYVDGKGYATSAMGDRNKR